tara:strand:+ start:155 stop:406 length:252 start_codon:yes stop_codon:yes gene_type:complete
MIKLIRHGNNETEITNGETPRQSVFFSYSTPVAGLDLKGFFKTSKKYSMTTTKHINKWLSKNNCNPKDVRILTPEEIKLHLYL